MSRANNFDTFHLKYWLHDYVVWKLWKTKRQQKKFTSENFLCFEVHDHLTRYFWKCDFLCFPCFIWKSFTEKEAKKKTNTITISKEICHTIFQLFCHFLKEKELLQLWLLFFVVWIGLTCADRVRSFSQTSLLDGWSLSTKVVSFFFFTLFFFLLRYFFDACWCRIWVLHTCQFRLWSCWKIRKRSSKPRLGISSSAGFSLNKLPVLLLCWEKPFEADRQLGGMEQKKYSMVNC